MVFALLFAGITSTINAQNSTAYGNWFAVTSETYPDFPVQHSDSVFLHETGGDIFSEFKALGVEAKMGANNEPTAFIHGILDSSYGLPDPGYRIKISWDIIATEEASSSIYDVRPIFIVNGVEFQPRDGNGKETPDTNWQVAEFNQFTDIAGNKLESKIDSFSEIYIRTDFSQGDICFIKEVIYHSVKNGEAVEYKIALNETVSGLDPIMTTPTQFELKQNYPNPFNPTTAIEFSIKKSEFVTLTIHDILGRKVAKLVQQKLHHGTYKFTFDASNLPSGTYFYKLSTGSGLTQTRKMIILK